MRPRLPPRGSILLGSLAEVPEGAPPARWDATSRASHSSRRRRARPGGARSTFPVVDPSTARESSASPPTARQATWSVRSRGASALRRHLVGDRPRAPRTLPAPAAGSAWRRARDAAARPRRRDRLRGADDLRRPARPADREARLLRRPRRELRVRHRGSTAATARGQLVLPRAGRGRRRASPRGTSRSSSNLAKVGAALAAGCTVVLKPSPLSPWSASAPRAARRRAHRLPGRRPQRRHVVLERGRRAADDAIHASTRSRSPGRRDRQGDGGRLGHGEARPPRAGRQVGERRARRRRPRGDRAAGGGVRLLQRRPELHPAERACSSRTSTSTRCLELAAEGLASVPVGDPTDPDVFMGPLISDDAARRASRATSSDGKADGARLVIGGGRRDDLGDGLLLRAHPVRRRRPSAPPSRRRRSSGRCSRSSRTTTRTMRSRSRTARSYGLAGYVWGGDAERAVGGRTPTACRDGRRSTAAASSAPTFPSADGARAGSAASGGLQASRSSSS